VDPAHGSRNADVVARSLAAVWHPCTQMKAHERFPLVPIARAEGAWLEDFDGRRYLDGVSSWWVNLFGHNHPRINAAIERQLRSLSHVMLAGFTHAPVVELSERLSRLAPPGLGHVFYASDGASAVEIALKMAFHHWSNRGKPGKNRFVALEGGYHGETVGALGVTDVPIFRDAYAPLVRGAITLPFPGTDPDAAHKLEALLEARGHEIAALILEPLVQGASGMRFYDYSFLRAARELCTRHEVLLIADEIMTGFGRTGLMFASRVPGFPPPDLMCLSKGITGGYLPLSCVLASEEVYASFYDDDVARGFLHSHSYTGNALACAAALAVLDIFGDDEVIARNAMNAKRWTAMAQPLAQHPRVSGFRYRGMIWAFEVAGTTPGFASRAFQLALERGVLLRPIGRTVYFMPPYVITDADFAKLVEAGLAIATELGE
jgi:adenosylmethionine-8-amino-7-oxononanoate aminotransferase